MIAVAHPGKIGDALYSLPTVRALCEHHNCMADFYTSEYCLPAKRFLEYQDCINEVIVPKDYKIEGFGMGIQPWEMPIPKGRYDAVYQCGFSSNPDKSLPDFIAQQHGLSKLPIQYDFPALEIERATPYIILAPRGSTGWPHLFSEFIDLCPFDVVQVGGKGDFIESNKETINLTGMDFLETCQVISQAHCFVGVFSAMLVLANGFPIKKIVPTDGLRWEIKHAVQSEMNFYPLNPSASDLMRLIGL